MKLLVVLSLLLVSCSHLKQSDLASTNRHLASSSCKHAFTTKKVRTVGIEFEGFFNTRKTNEQKILNFLLKYLDKNVLKTELYPIRVEAKDEAISNQRKKGSFSSVILSDKKELAAFIKKYNNLPTDLPFEKFVVSYTQKSKMQQWVVESEMTLYGSDYLRGFEVSSPIIHSPETQVLFLSFLKKLASLENIFVQHPQLEAKEVKNLTQTYLYYPGKQTGVKIPLTLSGGIHVHIGKENFTEKDVVLLIRTLLRVEKRMFEYFKVSKSRKKGPYIKTINNALKDFREENKHQDKNITWNQSVTKMVETLFKRVGKNTYIHVTVDNNLNTLEFRLFESTTNAKVIQHEVEFVTKLSQAVLDKDPSFMQFIESKKPVTRKGFLEFLSILDIKPMEIK